MKDTALESASRLGGAVISDRVVARLLDEMRTGCFGSCDHLPAEIELAAMLGVSRTVIRDALSEMERSGYIERVRGIGTVINRSVLNMRNRLDQKLEYYPLIRSLGGYPHADSIQIQLVNADEDLAKSLEIAPGDEVICIKKRVLSDSLPVIYSINYLAAGITPESTSPLRCSRFWKRNAASWRPAILPTFVPAAAMIPSAQQCIFLPAKPCFCWTRCALTGCAGPSCVRSVIIPITLISLFCVKCCKSNAHFIILRRYHSCAI